MSLYRLNHAECPCWKIKELFARWTRLFPLTSSRVLTTLFVLELGIMLSSSGTKGYYIKLSLWCRYV